MAALLATADPVAAVRARNQLRRDGFTLRVSGGVLQVAPIDRLSDPQRATIRQHKPALVALLQDAETLHAALVDAGASGLGWMAGTPGWDGTRLLAAGEVLYASGQMVNREGRRHLKECVPPAKWPEEAPTGDGRHRTADPCPDPTPRRTPTVRAVPNRITLKLRTQNPLGGKQTCYPITPCCPKPAR